MRKEQNDFFPDRPRFEVSIGAKASLEALDVAQTPPRSHNRMWQPIIAHGINLVRNEARSEVLGFVLMALVFMPFISHGNHHQRNVGMES